MRRLNTDSSGLACNFSIRMPEKRRETANRVDTGSEGRTRLACSSQATDLASAVRVRTRRVSTNTQREIYVRGKPQGASLERSHIHLYDEYQDLLVRICYRRVSRLIYFHYFFGEKRIKFFDAMVSCVLHSHLWMWLVWLKDSSMSESRLWFYINSTILANLRDQRVGNLNIWH